ncbi:hypothetical protein STEG23_015039 [Scotinomys teguina]
MQISDAKLCQDKLLKQDPVHAPTTFCPSLERIKLRLGKRKSNSSSSTVDTVPALTWKYYPPQPLEASGTPPGHPAVVPSQGEPVAVSSQDQSLCMVQQVTDEVDTGGANSKSWMCVLVVVEMVSQDFWDHNLQRTDQREEEKQNNRKDKKQATRKVTGRSESRFMFVRHGVKQP